MTAPWWQEWHMRTLAVLDASPWLRRTSWGCYPETHVHRQYDGNVCNAFGVDGREDDLDLQVSGMPRESAPWAYRHVRESQGLAFADGLPVVSIYQHGRSTFLAPAPFARVWSISMGARRDSDWSRAFYNHTRAMSVADLEAFAVALLRVPTLERVAGIGAGLRVVEAYLCGLGLPTREEAMRAAR